jgi:uncharacterized protein (TIGR03435 family)
MRSIGITTSGSRLNADAVSVRGLIMYAYDHQVLGTAPLLAGVDTRYDIAAKAEGDGVPAKSGFRRMLQLLLADRCNLGFHRETPAMPCWTEQDSQKPMTSS